MTSAVIPAPPPAQLTTGLILLMATAVGLIVGNLYYVQPLMGVIARDFGVADATIGYAVTLCQSGLALGTLTILPLGDVTDRRRLICLSCLFAATSLVIMGFSPNAGLFLAANFLLGLTSVATHLQVSYAAHLAPPDKRGHAVGAVMSGLLVGILVARTISGYLGAWYGWRFMLMAAAAVTYGLAAALWLLLPRDDESHTIRYRDLLLSMPRLFTNLQVLRDSCVYGAITFAVFNAFWATITFYLEGPPFRMDSRGIGLFSMAAVAGALTANFAGRLTNRIRPVVIIAWSLVITLTSFGVFLGWGTSLVGMVVGIVLMDLGIQATHIGNQTRVHGLMPEARSRLHCVYMVTYFLGGAIGSALGTWAFARLGWPGLCLVGAGLTTVALGYWWHRQRTNKREKAGNIAMTGGVSG